MTRIAHITDLHFGAEDPAVVAALLAELQLDRPDLVAISGDLTMGAHRREYTAARDFIDRLGVPALAVPGNHDITPYRLLERFADPYARWRALIAEQTEPVWMDDRVAVFGLNTAHRMDLSLDWSRGSVTGRRLRRLLARIAASPAGLTRIVVAHHPLAPPEGEPELRIAGGAARALAAFAQAGVKLVLAGHLHRGYARFATLDSPSPLILQGATATSVRLRGEPNAYNRVTIGPDGSPEVEVRIWDGAGWASRPAPGIVTPIMSPSRTMPAS